jgi:hypothetical protein
MHVKIINTYVCISATPSSRPNNITKMIIGNINPIEVKFSNSSILQENPIMTFKRLCPAIKFIKSRTPKLIGLAIYEINSIGTRSRAKKKEVFAGKNKEKVFILYFSNVIMLIPIKTENESVNVIIK